MERTARCRERIEALRGKVVVVNGTEKCHMFSQNLIALFTPVNSPRVSGIIRNNIYDPRSLGMIEDFLKLLEVVDKEDNTRETSDKLTVS